MQSVEHTDAYTPRLVRVQFSKTGRARYISHLDLSRAMTRAMRRAEIPLWYTEGFNRHPYITFAAPLSLGVESFCETMDIRLEEDMPMGDLCNRLNEVMPEGLAILSAAPAEKKPGELGFARYRIAFTGPRKAVEDCLVQDSILVMKRTKKKTVKEMDIKPFLEDITWSDTENGCILELTLPLGASQTINPALLVEAVTKQTGAAAITRLKLYCLDKTLFC